MSNYQVNPKFDNNNLDATSFENNVALIHKVSNQVFRRIMAAGISLEYDDVFQEGCLVWVKAKDSFKPEAGYRFSSYFVRALHNEMNRKLDKQVNDLDEYAVSYTADATNEESERLTLDSIVTGESASPEIEEMSYEAVLEFADDLSVFAKFALKNIITPSKVIVREFEMLRHKTEMFRAQGYMKRFKHEIDLAFVLSVLTKVTGKSSQFGRDVRKEIENKAKRYLARA